MTDSRPPDRANGTASAAAAASMSGPGGELGLLLEEMRVHSALMRESISLQRELLDRVSGMLDEGAAEVVRRLRRDGV